MVKRGFKGDAKVYEAAVSEDGKLMVVLDTRQDEKVRVWRRHMIQLEGSGVVCGVLVMCLDLGCSAFATVATAYIFCENLSKDKSYLQCNLCNIFKNPVSEG